MTTTALRTTLLTILTSGVLAMTACNKEKPTSENPGEGEGTPAGDDAAAGDAGGGEEPPADGMSPEEHEKMGGGDGESTPPSQD